ncbi:hypothetical protein ACFV9C_24835 [Kribbella sp. NPDC059898]|uniref:hypothetical protein n=1 Tax=Kribbella sp. NPDC059898 TaxID=3346995 RepID=UPI0036526A3E
MDKDEVAGRTAQIVRALTEADAALRQALSDPEFDQQLGRAVTAVDRVYESAAEVARFEQPGGGEVDRRLVHAQQETQRQVDRIASNLGHLRRSLEATHDSGQPRGTLAVLQDSRAKLRTAMENVEALGGSGQEKSPVGALGKHVEKVKQIVEGAAADVQRVADRLEDARRGASRFGEGLPRLGSGEVARTIRSKSEQMGTSLASARQGMTRVRTAIGQNEKPVDAAVEAAPGLVEKITAEAEKPAAGLDPELAKSMQAATNPTPQSQQAGEQVSYQEPAPASRLQLSRPDTGVQL